jgi:group I intron endonuclease
MPEPILYGIVYGLYDPRTGELRYIGQTVRSLRGRLVSHLSKANLKSSQYSAKWLSSLKKAGVTPTTSCLGEAYSRESLDKLEIKLIAEARERGEKLTNLAPGGISSSGYKLGPEFGSKVSNKLRGRSKSPEHRLKLSEANRGKKHNAEAKAKISASRIGHPVSEETRAKQSASMKGHSVSAETKAKMSRTKKGVPFKLKGHKYPPEIVAKFSLCHQGIRPTEETRKKMSAAHRGTNLGSANSRYRPELPTDSMIAGLQSGMSRKQVAERYGITPRLVARRLVQAERAGIPNVPKSNRGIPTEIILQKLGEGLSKSQVAEELGISMPLIYLRLRKYGALNA